MKDIKHDLIVMGATGFTGKLVVEYLIKNYGVLNQHFTWAIAGRSLSKLEKLKIHFMSADFKKHSVAFFIRDLLKKIDKSIFEISLINS